MINIGTYFNFFFKCWLPKPAKFDRMMQKICTPLQKRNPSSQRAIVSILKCSRVLATDVSISIWLMHCCDNFVNKQLAADKFLHIFDDF